MASRIGDMLFQTASRFGARRFLWVAVIGVFVFVVASLRGIGNLKEVVSAQDWDEFFPAQVTSIFSSPASARQKEVPKKTTIAYAVSVTQCNSEGLAKLQDGAAVLHQSIRLASRDSRYDYYMVAFVHPSANECAAVLRALGYEVQIRPTPFNDTIIQNDELALAQENSCCGTKEYLKLYSYLLVEFPVVVHLDLDCLVLRPLDDVFDLMLDPGFNRSRIPIMHLKPTELPDRVDFVFTRDYGMVEPGVRHPHQIGVQGGFLIFRPNETDFYRNIEIIASGANFSLGWGWGGEGKAFGGYYGAGTIQGLASYYYGEISPNRSVELNRCYFNNMADDPYGDRKNDTCRTLESECQDCRQVHIKDVITTHFTNCGKPFWCSPPSKHEKKYRMCMEQFQEWHRVRRSLENEWSDKYPDYQPVFATNTDWNAGNEMYLNFSQGHCERFGGYINMQYPNLTSDIPLLPKKRDNRRR